MYAVDTPALARFLAQPVGSLLSYYAQHGKPDAQSLSFEDGDRRFVAQPRVGVFCTQSGERSDASMEEEFLRRPMKAILMASSSYELKFVLDALCVCPSIEFVRCVIDGHRRWWLESVLSFVHRLLDVREHHWLAKPDDVKLAFAFAPEDCARFVRLGNAVLRRYGDGPPPNDVEIAACGFPIIPADDADLQIGLWSDVDAYFVSGFLRQLRALPATFVSEMPQHDGNEDWDRYVNSMLDRIIALEDLVEFEKLAVLSFIG